MVAAARGAIEAVPDDAGSGRLSTLLSNLAANIESATGGSALSMDGAGPVPAEALTFDARLHPSVGSEVGPVTVSIFDIDSSPMVASLQDRLIVDARQLAGIYEPEVIERSDLGPGAFQVIDDAATTLFIYDPVDGTTFRVLAGRSDTARPASIEEQLALLSSLVPMSRDALEAEVARRGISELGSTTGPTTTTTEPAPATSEGP